MTNQCEHPDCNEFEYLTTLFNPWCDDDPHNGLTFCAGHVPWGFCKVCGRFAAGSDGYDFSPIEGVCGLCVGLIRADCGEDVEYGEVDCFPGPWDR